MSLLFWHWVPLVLPAEVDEYPEEALLADIRGLERAWNRYRKSRKRSAVYGFLTYVFDLVLWWEAENLARWSFLHLAACEGFEFDNRADPFVKVIRMVAKPRKLDRKRLSKWSLALNYARHFKRQDQSLRDFVRDNGGINACSRRGDWRE
jgi:hypothetical protein